MSILKRTATLLLGFRWGFETAFNHFFGITGIEKISGCPQFLTI